MDEAFKKQAAEWFERGRHDIETAQLLDEQRGHTDVIAYHIHQAIEKHLKGYLVLHGRKPPRIHELDALLDLVCDMHPSLDAYRELCEKASRYYIEARYPTQAPVEYDREEIKTDLAAASHLIDTIRAKPNGV